MHVLGLLENIWVTRVNSRRYSEYTQTAHLSAHDIKKLWNFPETVHWSVLQFSNLSVFFFSINFTHNEQELLQNIFSLFSETYLL